MGLTKWVVTSKDKIVKSDAIIAKNYPIKYEMRYLARIVTAYTDLVAYRAERIFRWRLRTGQNF